MAGNLGRVWAGIRLRLGLDSDEPMARVAVDDDSATVLLGVWDPARADTSVVAELTTSGIDLASPMLLRHHLRMPDADAASRAAARVEPDGYAAVIEDPAVDQPGRPASSLHARLPVRLRLSRAQKITGLALAQERSRMAGLAQRHGGDVEGYDLLTPRPEPPPSG